MDLEEGLPLLVVLSESGPYYAVHLYHFQREKNTLSLQLTEVSYVNLY